MNAVLVFIGNIFLFPGNKLLKILNADIHDEGGLFRSLINTVVWTTLGVIAALIMFFAGT